MPRNENLVTTEIKAMKQHALRDIPDGITDVWVLSGYGTVTDNFFRKFKKDHDRRRFNMGVRIAKRAAAKYLGIKSRHVTKEAIGVAGIGFLYNGLNGEKPDYPRENDAVRELVHSPKSPLPSKLVTILDLPEGKAHTGGQAEQFGEYHTQNRGRTAIITNWYHLPRVVRYPAVAQVIDNDEVVLVALSDPWRKRKQIREKESSSIAKYLAKGDLVEPTVPTNELNVVYLSHWPRIRKIDHHQI